MTAAFLFFILAFASAVVVNAWLFVQRSKPASIAPSVEAAIQRCAALSVEQGNRQAMTAAESMKQMCLAGLYGSTVPDLVRIRALEEDLKFKDDVIESYRVALERALWVVEVSGE